MPWLAGVDGCKKGWFRVSRESSSEELQFDVVESVGELFGQPPRPAIVALDMPIVSGNVSLYNETDGAAILPTPTIGAVGLIAENDAPIIGKAREGHVLLLLGESGGHLGQSALLHSACGAPMGMRLQWI